MRGVISISARINKLPKKNKALFNRLFYVSEDLGRLKIPEEMKTWVKDNFKNVKNVEVQKIVRIDNRITFQSAIFNELRSFRPIDAHTDEQLLDLIEKTTQGPFSHPLTSTPEDIFGRIKGEKCITASNIAKYDAYHDLIIFNEHNPLKFTQKEIEDYLHTAKKWIDRVYERRPERKYPYIMWNCLWKAGASIVHGHMQVVMAKDRHYGIIERIRFFSEVYKEHFGSDYFEDLYKVHKSVGLGFKHGKSKVMCSLTPIKDKEIIIIAEKLEDVSKTIYKVLKSYLKMGVESFDVGIYLSPLDNSWKMPLIVRIVDRGKLSNKTTDFGGMEIFAGTSIIETDPYKVLANIRKN